ncbi:MAG: polysaccharide biosynthesis protein, partial [Chromatiaceae bacterium]
MNPWFERLRSRMVAFLHDLVMIPCAWMLAYWVRFNLGEIPSDFLSGALTALPLVVAVQGATYWRFGLYRGVWRFASLPDLMRIGKAVLAASAITFLALFILNRMETVPRSVPVLFVMFQMLLLAGPRLLYRWVKDHRLDLHAGERVLIVGAGRAGEMLVRDMLRDPAHAYLPVAFVDDKLRRHGGELHGIPVRGGTEAIPELAHSLSIQLVLLAIPSASAAEMQRLVGLCERAGKPFRTVPQLESLMAGQVSINQLRPVSIEDLLGRNPVQLDWDGIEAGLSGRRILVTGAGGSIGAELCRQIVRASPGRLILVDHGEFNLYAIEMELKENHP